MAQAHGLHALLHRNDYIGMTFRATAKEAHTKASDREGATWKGAGCTSPVGAALDVLAQGGRRWVC
jgi:hypothetical protein